MDDSLRLIQYLYDEDVDPGFARRVSEDETLRQDYEELKQAKEALDRRSSPSPDPDVVDQIVDRAAEAAPSRPTDRQASDRAATSPDRGRRRVVRGLSTAIAVVILAGIGWWSLPIGTETVPSTATESTAQRTESSETTPAAGPDAQSLPEWDDRDEVVRLHRRIEQLQTRHRSDDWGGDLQSASQTRP